MPRRHLTGRVSVAGYLTRAKPREISLCAQPAMSPQSDVVVMASRQSDQRLFAELVERAGYRADSQCVTEPAGEYRSEALATIVCHRACSSMPEPGVPRVARGSRIVVISDCTTEKAVVQALESGAHHYFDIQESPAILQVRLEAALRQHARTPQRYLEVGPFRFDLLKRQVFVNQQAVSLSPKEYEFAHYVFTHRDRVVENNELMTSVWTLPSEMDSRRIDTAACRVRKKMQLGPDTGWYLRRLRRVGYRLQQSGSSVSG